jgi:hypothetical protein
LNFQAATFSPSEKSDYQGKNRAKAPRSVKDAAALEGHKVSVTGLAEMIVIQSAIRTEGKLQYSPVQVPRIKGCTLQICAAQVGTTEVRSGQIDIGQVGVSQICFDQVSSAQVGTAEIDSPQVFTTQRAIMQVQTLHVRSYDEVVLAIGPHVGGNFGTHDVAFVIQITDVLFHFPDLTRIPKRKEPTNHPKINQ